MESSKLVVVLIIMGFAGYFRQAHLNILTLSLLCFSWPLEELVRTAFLDCKAWEVFLLVAVNYLTRKFQNMYFFVNPLETSLMNVDGALEAPLLLLFKRVQIQPGFAWAVADSTYALPFAWAKRDFVCAVLITVHANQAQSFAWVFMLRSTRRCPVCCGIPFSSVADQPAFPFTFCLQLVPTTIT